MKYLELSVVGLIRFNEKRIIAISKLDATKAYEKNCMRWFRISVAP